MTVFVDDAFIPFQSMQMSHMIAETSEELHSMADAIGLKRSWYQDKGSFPHYDVSERKRELAIQHGAVPLTQRELVQKVQQLRKRKNG